MKTLAISGTARAEIGRKNAETIRKEGLVPCVLYGGKENLHFSVDERELNKIAYTRDTYAVDLDIDGSKFRTVMQDLQFHPTTERLLHMDFIETTEDKPITVNLPVTLEGKAKGILVGGVMRFNRTRLRVKGLPSAIPDEIFVDIKDLEIGDVIKVEDIKVPNIEFVDPPNAVVVGVKRARTLEDLLGSTEEEEVDLESMTDEEREEYEKQQAEAAEAGEGEEGGEASGEGGAEKPAEGGDGGGEG